MSLLRKLWRWLRELAGAEVSFLCDTCAYDHPNSCRRPERPNATDCPDYKRR